MGLPTILGVKIEGRGMHALTLAGYSERKNRINQQEVASGEKSIPLVGLRIDELYAHDDQIGPFSRLVIKPSSKDYPVLLEGSWQDSQTKKILTLQPIFLLVPVYNKIRVTFLDILKWLERMGPLLSLLLTQPQDIEWDVFITTNNMMKDSINKEPFPVDDLKRLLVKQNPRFIWRAILRINSQPLLEFFADGTDMERSFPFYELVWHNVDFHEACKKVLDDNRLTNILIELLEQVFYNFLKN
jgi:hypothetical protein